MTYDKILKPGEEIQLVVEQNRKIFYLYFIVLLYLPFLLFTLFQESETFVIIMGILLTLFIAFTISNLFRKGMLITNTRIISVGIYKIQEIEKNQLEKFKEGVRLPFFNAQTIFFIGKENKFIIFPYVKNYSLVKEK